MNYFFKKVPTLPEILEKRLADSEEGRISARLRLAEAQAALQEWEVRCSILREERDQCSTKEGGYLIPPDVTLNDGSALEDYLRKFNNAR